jgi:DedD protein
MTPQAQDDDETLRRRLLVRVALAGALTAGLLGALMVFDAFFVNTERQPPVRIAAAPIPIPEAKIEQQPEEEKPAVQGEAQTEAEKTAEVAAEPERTSAPTATQPPVRTERPLTVPARVQTALMRPTALPAIKQTTPTRPIAQAMEASHRFLVQIGVFNSVANAEELRAKLELAGIPTQIEARVQVGPFATRQEAQQARDKLKDLGIEPGLVMAVRK